MSTFTRRQFFQSSFPLIVAASTLGRGGAVAANSRIRDADIAGAKEQLKGKTEMDALVAYLQVLGTLVRFTDLSPADLRQ